MVNFPLDKRIIIFGLAGSHSYGMATEQSDIDLRGICVAPLDVRLSSYQRFEQYEGNLIEDSTIMAKAYYHPKLEHVEDKDDKLNDTVIYDIAKAVKLMGDCNPNMLEILFCDNEDYIHITDLGLSLLEKRNKFLNLKTKHTYTGYAMSQLKKIERHRGYLLQKPPEKPERKDFGLPEHESLIPQAERNLINEEVKKRISEWTADNIELNAAERITLNENLRSFMCYALKVKDEQLDDELEDLAASSLGFNQDVREILKRERSYRNRLREFKSYKRWESERNPKRKELEKKFNFDTKHASHLIRLGRQGVEILSEGKLIVRRPDAEELLGIRRGERTFEDVKEEAENLLEKMNQLYVENPCNLPRKPDTKFLDNLTREIILKSLT